MFGFVVVNRRVKRSRSMVLGTQEASSFSIVLMTIGRDSIESTFDCRVTIECKVGGRRQLFVSILSQAFDAYDSLLRNGRKGGLFAALFEFPAKTVAIRQIEADLAMEHSQDMERYFADMYKLAIRCFSENLVCVLGSFPDTYAQTCV